MKKALLIMGLVLGIVGSLSSATAQDEDSGGDGYSDTWAPEGGDDTYIPPPEGSEECEGEDCEQSK